MARALGPGSDSEIIPVPRLGIQIAVSGTRNRHSTGTEYAAAAMATVTILGSHNVDRDPDSEPHVCLWRRALQVVCATQACAGARIY